MAKNNNEGLKEIGKALLAFANLITALYVINIVLISKDYWQGLVATIGFLVIYYVGYRFIKKGSN